ncbi:MAG: hypothetical protein M3R41_06260 [Pseudomonadota bacterium]|nr:hypothetical protein [Pseudomonadota bacterium]
MDEMAPTIDPIPLADIAPRRGPRWRVPAMLALLAFAAGIAATIYGLRFYDHWSNAAKPVAATMASIPPGPKPLADGDVTVPAAGQPTIDSLTAREAELSARLAELEARTVTITTDARAASGNAGRAEALLITFAARRAIERGQSLGYAADELRVRFGANQPGAVSAVLQASRAPVTLEDLRAGLDGVGPLLSTGAASEGWWASLRRQFGNLVVIHDVSTPSTLPADRLTRARRMLDAGQVEAALNEVIHLPGASGAGAWIAAAQRYIAARQALDTLEAAAVQGQAAVRP